MKEEMVLIGFVDGIRRYVRKEMSRRSGRRRR